MLGTFQMPGAMQYQTMPIRLPRGDAVLRIALTGWGQESDRLCIREAGFHHHLVKPVQAEVLAALIA